MNNLIIVFMALPVTMFLIISCDFTIKIPLPEMEIINAHVRIGGSGMPLRICKKFQW